VAGRAPLGAIAYMRFGFDAYRLVPALRSNSLSGPTRLRLTGKLRLDDHNRIRRELDWRR